MNLCVRLGVAEELQAGDKLLPLEHLPLLMPVRDALAVLRCQRSIAVHPRPALEQLFFTFLTSLSACILYMCGVRVAMGIRC